MKRALLGFLAAISFVGIASAEPIRGEENLANYNVYRSSNIPDLTNQISYGAYLHKVIVSSPAAVTGTGGSTISFYNASGSASNKVFSISASTNDLTGFNDFDFGIYFASGIYTVNQTTGAAGSIQAIFARNGPPANAKVWSSSFSAVDTSTHIISAGPVLLHSVSVLTKGAGTTAMTIHDAYNSAPNNKVAVVDLTAVKQYTYDILLSSGLVMNVASVGSGTPAQVLITYRRNPRGDYESWKPYYVTGTVTNQTVASGTYVLGGAVNGTAAATGQLTIYDSQASATKKITDIDAVSTFGKKMFDVTTSSGITVTNVGTGTFTILYKKR